MMIETIKLGRKIKRKKKRLTKHEHTNTTHLTPFKWWFVAGTRKNKHTSTHTKQTHTHIRTHETRTRANTDTHTTLVITYICCWLKFQCRSHASSGIAGDIGADTHVRPTRNDTWLESPWHLSRIKEQSIKCTCKSGLMCMCLLVRMRVCVYDYYIAEPIFIKTLAVCVCMQQCMWVSTDVNKTPLNRVHQLYPFCVSNKKVTLPTLPR